MASSSSGSRPSAGSGVASRGASLQRMYTPPKASLAAQVAGLGPADLIKKGTFGVHLISAAGLVPNTRGGSVNPYAVLEWGKNKHRSSKRAGTLAPQWDERFSMRGGMIDMVSRPLLIRVFDADRTAGNDALGELSLSLEPLRHAPVEQAAHDMRYCQAPITVPCHAMASATLLRPVEQVAQDDRCARARTLHVCRPLERPAPKSRKSERRSGRLSGLYGSPAARQSDRLQEFSPLRAPAADASEVGLEEQSEPASRLAPRASPRAQGGQGAPAAMHRAGTAPTKLIASHAPPPPPLAAAPAAVASEVLMRTPSRTTGQDVPGAGTAAADRAQSPPAPLMSPEGFGEVTMILTWTEDGGVTRPRQLSSWRERSSSIRERASSLTHAASTKGSNVMSGLGGAMRRLTASGKDRQPVIALQQSSPKAPAVAPLTSTLLHHGVILKAGSVNPAYQPRYLRLDSDPAGGASLLSWYAGPNQAGIFGSARQTPKGFVRVAAVRVTAGRGRRLCFEVYPTTGKAETHERKRILRLAVHEEGERVKWMHALRRQCSREGLG